MDIKSKSLQTSIKLASQSKDGTPTPEQLALINGYTLKEHSADEMYVRTFIVAHTALDRDKEIISDGLLQNIADTLAGKGFFIKHPMSQDGDSGPGVGKWFDTEVVTMSLDDAKKALGETVEFSPTATTAKLLYASAYVPRTNKHADTIADIDAGVAGFVSASFSYSNYEPIEKDGDVIGYFLSGKGEAREASLVWLGAQPGARAVKAANQQKPEDSEMDELTKLKNAMADLTASKGTLEATLTTEKSAREKAESELQTFKDACGGHSPDAIKALLAEQTKQKNALIDTLVAADRNAGKCGDDEAAIKGAKEKYTAYPMDALLDLDAANKANKSANIGGGDPNAGRPGGDANKLDDCPV